MEQSMNHDTGKKVCKCPHHRVVPLMILIIGVAYLLMNLHLVTALALGWIVSLALIVIGGSKLFEHRCTCC